MSPPIDSVTPKSLVALLAESVAFGWPEKNVSAAGTAPFQVGPWPNRGGRALLTDAPILHHLIDFSALPVGTRTGRAFHGQNGHTARCSGATLKV